ncbi:TPA: hypothetical protein ACPEUE_003832 [Proteus mirabilis]
MSYSDVMSTIATIISFVAIPATYYNGIRVGRINDKRKEFNAVADPIYIRLIKAKKDLDLGLCVHRSLVNEKEILNLSIHMKEKEREKLIVAYKEFCDAVSMIKWDKYHKPTLEDDVRQKIVESLKPLIDLTKHR